MNVEMPSANAPMWHIDLVDSDEPIKVKCCKRLDESPKDADDLGEGLPRYCPRPAMGLWEQNREAYCTEHAPTPEQRQETVAWAQRQWDEADAFDRAFRFRGNPVVPTWIPVPRAMHLRATYQYSSGTPVVFVNATAQGLRNAIARYQHRDPRSRDMETGEALDLGAAIERFAISVANYLNPDEGRA